jgi:hypothetical protein
LMNPVAFFFGAIFLSFSSFAKEILRVFVLG